MSRSALNDEVGVKTQLSALFSVGLLVSIICALGEYFETLPLCVLASIIVVNLKRLILQVTRVVELWRASKADAIVWMIVFCTVILGGLMYGLIVGIISCCMSAIVRTRYTIGVSLTPVAGVWVDTSNYSVEWVKRKFVLADCRPLGRTTNFVNFDFLTENDPK